MRRPSILRKSKKTFRVVYHPERWQVLGGQIHKVASKIVKGTKWHISGWINLYATIWILFLKFIKIQYELLFWPKSYRIFLVYLRLQKKPLDQLLVLWSRPCTMWRVCPLLAVHIHVGFHGRVIVEVGILPETYCHHTISEDLFCRLATTKIIIKKLIENWKNLK